MTFEQPVKPQPSAAERRARKADQLQAIRLKMAIGRKLDEQGVISPAAIGDALSLLAAEAVGLLSRKRFREGDLAQLEAVAVRLGL